MDIFLLTFLTLLIMLPAIIVIFSGRPTSPPSYSCNPKPSSSNVYKVEPDTEKHYTVPTYPAINSSVRLVEEKPVPKSTAVVKRT